MPLTKCEWKPIRLQCLIRLECLFGRGRHSSKKWPRVCFELPTKAVLEKHQQKRTALRTGIYAAQHSNASGGARPQQLEFQGPRFVKHLNQSSRNIKKSSHWRKNRIEQAADGFEMTASDVPEGVIWRHLGGILVSIASVLAIMAWHEVKIMSASEAIEPLVMKISVLEDRLKKATPKSNWRDA